MQYRGLKFVISRRLRLRFSPSSPGFDSPRSQIFFSVLGKINSMLQRFIDSCAAYREWTVQGLIVDQTHLILVSGKLVLNKVGACFLAKFFPNKTHESVFPLEEIFLSKNSQVVAVFNAADVSRLNIDDWSDDVTKSNHQHLPVSSGSTFIKL